MRTWARNPWTRSKSFLRSRKNTTSPIPLRADEATRLVQSGAGAAPAKSNQSDGQDVPFSTGSAMLPRSSRSWSRRKRRNEPGRYHRDRNSVTPIWQHARKILVRFGRSQIGHRPGSPSFRPSGSTPASPRRSSISIRPNISTRKRESLLDRFAQFAVVAARSAVRDAQLQITEEIALQAATIVGNSTGGMNTIDDSYHPALRAKCARCHPLTISTPDVQRRVQP